MLVREAVALLLAQDQDAEVRVAEPKRGFLADHSEVVSIHPDLLVFGIFLPEPVERAVVVISSEQFSGPES